VVAVATGEIERADSARRRACADAVNLRQKNSAVCSNIF
jgi:hypothetical protein